MVTRFYIYYTLLCAGIILAFTSGSWAQSVADLSSGIPVNTVPNNLVIKLKPAYKQVAANRQRKASNLADPLKEVLTQINTTTYQQKFPRATTYPALKPGEVDLTLIYQVQYQNKSIPFTKIRQLFLSTGQVEYVEPLYIPEILHQPNDPHADSVVARQYHLKQSQIYKAWDFEKGDSTIVIGILDTGTRFTHEDLAKNAKRNYADPVDGRDNDNDGFIDNFYGWDTADKDNNITGTNGHGTLVTGLAAGTTHNTKGIAGVGYNCRYLPVKVFSSVTNGPFGGYEGIVYAADHGCQVINLSWGGENPFSQFEQDVINYAAINKNVVIVAAAGNTPKEAYIYPASYDNVVSVGAVDNKDVKASFQTFNYALDLTAAGVSVTTTSFNGDNTYGAASGSSISSPIVAGAAALLRKKFPQYTALQIAERLRVTADNNYGAGTNNTYLEKIGYGRLNLYNALTAAQPKAVRNTSNTYDPRQAFAGNTLNLSGTFQNILSPVTNLTVTLSSESPYVTVIRSTFAVGTMATMANTNNNQQPFQVIISDNIPFNQPVVLRYGFSDGEYTDYQYFTITLNPNYLTLRIGDLDATITSKSNIGYHSYNPLQGESVFYKNAGPLLSEGGLMIGTSASRVSDNIRSAVNRADQDFTPVQSVRFVNTKKRADEEAYGSFKDIYPQTGTVGVFVKQRALAWQNAPDNQYIILEYTLTNTTQTAFNNLHAGLFADWDIGNYLNNTAAWDSVTRTGYTYPTEQKNLFTGVSLLTGQSATTYAISSTPATSTSINMNDGFSTAEKFTTLSNVSRQNRAAGGTNQDVMQVVGGVLNTLEPGKSVTIAFALVGAESAPDMQVAARAAQSKYALIKSGPVLLTQNDSVCTGERVTIRPEGGKVFKFYADADRKQLLKTGSSYTTNPISTASTYYITNVDSLYESPVTAATFYPVNTTVDFTNATRITSSTDANNVLFTDLTPAARQWFWDFGNGLKSTEQNPVTRYNAPGTYQVKLKVTNQYGCTDSITKAVTFSRSALPQVRNDSTCVATTITLQPGGGKSFKFYSDATGKNLLGIGSSFTTSPLLQNTTYYVSNTDGYFESELVPVTITITNLEPEFTFSPDPVPAGAKGWVMFTDLTLNARQWSWDFGNGTQSQEQNPKIQYKQPGNYTVTLTVTDLYGCTETISKQVEIKYIDYIHQWTTNEVLIYPVPTPDILKVMLSEAIDVTQGITIELVNAIGKVILKKVVYQTGLHHLDLQNQAAGIYILRISGKDNSITRRIEVLH